MSSIIKGITDENLLATYEKQLEDKVDENLRDWFKEKWVRFGPDGKIRGDCARGDDSEGKPKCLPQKKAHALGKKGRASAAARKRREDPNPERHGKAKNVATKKKTNEVQQCPKCGGEMVSEEMINEKKDACYYKVKSRYKVWPSAYASGALVKCRKKGASNWGKSKTKESAISSGMLIAEQSDFSRMLKNITAQNPKGSAAEKQILNHFIASPQGVYANNVLGSNKSKDWIKQAMYWLQLPKVLPHLKNKYEEVDFSDLEELAHRMHEDWLARTGKLEEGKVAPMYPLVVAGHPFDWNVYDLRNNKIVASVIGGDRSESKLYEIRINRNGMTNETRMPPTYVLTAGAHDNPPYKAYELVAPKGGFGKIEKSPGPGGTTKLRPDQDDVLRHFFKILGGGRYYGYDLNLVEEGLDQWELVEKALGAKIMDVDTANELGYTDWDPEDSSSIVYLGNQKNEGYSAGAVGGAGIGEGQIYSTGGGPGQGYTWYKPQPAGLKEYNILDKIKKPYDPPKLGELEKDLLFMDSVVATLPKGLKIEQVYGAVRKALDKKNAGLSFQQQRNSWLGIKMFVWDAYQKAIESQKPQWYKKIKSKMGLEEEQLDEKCWDTHKQVGMKSKGGKMVPNCVPKESAVMKGITKENMKVEPVSPIVKQQQTQTQPKQQVYTPNIKDKKTPAAIIKISKKP
jgi:hypothetical protein